MSPRRARSVVSFDLLAAELGRELCDDAAHHLGREAGAALRHVLDPLDELVGRRALDEVADGARPEHLQDVRRSS